MRVFSFSSQWVAVIAALNGVKPNFGGGGIKAGLKRASVN